MINKKILNNVMAYINRGRGSLARQGGGFEIHCPQGLGSSNLPPGAMLSDSDIIRALDNGDIKISGFDEKHLTPNGYDLSIGEVFIPSVNTHIKSGKVEITALTRFLVGTMETIKLSNKYAAQLWIKSRWTRRGIIASFGMVDAGFNGTLTLGAFATDRITLEIGDRFVQIVFLKLKNPSEKGYDKRSGNYQNQKGIRI